ncbi:metallophosphoesterase family protein [Pseudalkalibacillus sp. NRS-1564]|uniref:metallophosphoesterase family protein n=1 Tax=Pseudalkalibacillus sp. NRS-1564 TaxID=3233900 RepID=UPI003D2C66CD
MKEVTFLHCADLHLDRPFSGTNQLPKSIHEFVRESAYRSLRTIVDIAINQRVDFVLFAGDLFDSSYRSLKAQMILLQQLKRLDEAGIYSYLSHGNHDALDGEWVDLTWPDTSYFFGAEVESVSYNRDQTPIAYIHGFSYPTRHVNEKMVSAYERVDEESFQIGMLHGNLEGQTEHSSYAPFTITELMNKKFDYWALGHIHQRAILSEEPFIVYPGNIQGAHSKERGEKGCYVVKLSDSEPSLVFHQTADVTWHKSIIDIGQCDTIQDLLNNCEEILNQETFSTRGHFINFELVGNSPIHSELIHGDHLEDILQTLQLNREMEDEGFVWPYKFTLKSMPLWDRENLKQQNGFLQDILFTSDQYEHSQMKEALAPLFEHRRARKALHPIEDEQQLIKEAEELLLTYLIESKGGES